MPMVKIDIVEGKTASYKKAVLIGVHKALFDAIGIPETDNFQRLNELPVDNFICPSDRSDQMTIIEITLFPGRSDTSKKKLYEKIVEYLGVDPGIKGNDIMIILHEPPMKNWGVRGGKPANEVDFGFKIDV
jgi:phenylpyruvate tautomerase PptA (4-oxalocrotonate tautomerase family)